MKIFKRILAIILLVALGVGGYYTYAYWNNISNYFTGNKNQIEIVESVENINTFSNNKLNNTACANADDVKYNTSGKFYIKVDFPNLGNVDLITQGMVNPGKALGVPKRGFFEWDNNRTWYKIKADIEIQIFPKDSEEAFVLVVPGEFVASRSWADDYNPNPILTECDIQFRQSYEFYFDNEDYYKVLTEEKPNFHLMFRGSDYHYKAMVRKPYKPAVFSSKNYTISKTPQTDDPEQGKGDIDNPEFPTEPGDSELTPTHPIQREETKFEKWFKTAFDFINYRWSDLSGWQQAVRVIEYILISIGGILLLALFCWALSKLFSVFK